MIGVNASPSDHSLRKDLSGAALCIGAMIRLAMIACLASGMLASASADEDIPVSCRNFSGKGVSACLSYVAAKECIRRSSDRIVRLSIQVTCGSVVKLKHATSEFDLHSHEISYGSGSGQQSVTGYKDTSDAASLWAVKGAKVWAPCL